MFICPPPFRREKRHSNQKQVGEKEDDNDGLRCLEGWIPSPWLVSRCVEQEDTDWDKSVDKSEGVGRYYIRIKVSYWESRSENQRIIQLIRNKKISPGGIARRKVQEMRYWVKSPASGALKGLLLAKKEAKGRTPSRPSSWMTWGKNEWVWYIVVTSIKSDLVLERIVRLVGYPKSIMRRINWAPEKIVHVSVKA